MAARRLNSGLQKRHVNPESCQNNRSASRENVPVPCIKWRTLGELNQGAIFRKLGGVAYRGRVLRILISYRVDLSIGSSWVEVRLQQRLHISIAGPKRMVTFVRPREKRTDTPTYLEEKQEKTVWKQRCKHRVLHPRVSPRNRRERRKWTHVPSSST